MGSAYSSFSPKLTSELVPDLVLSCLQWWDDEGHQLEIGSALMEIEETQDHAIEIKWGKMRYFVSLPHGTAFLWIYII